MTIWLTDATVTPASRQIASGSWIELTPTGTVRPAGDLAPGDIALHGAGIEVDPTPQHEALADALQQAIVTGDTAAASRLYAEDLVVWHNYDAEDRNKKESLDLITGLTRDYAHFDALDIRRDYLPDGYVQRTVFFAVDHAGVSQTVDAMMRVWVREGQITRIEEYSAHAPEPDHGTTHATDDGWPADHTTKESETTVSLREPSNGAPRP